MSDSNLPGSGFEDEALERAALASVDVAEAAALLERFASLVRESGTPDEHAAGRYIVERLEALGVAVTVHEPDLYLSIPERAELELLDGPTPESVRCRPPAFARSTGGMHVEGELCYLPSRYAGGTAALFDTADAARAGSAGRDPVAGRIVLTEGFSMPGTVRAFEERGAIAQVFIHPGAEIHEGICTTIWGAPTSDSIRRKPQTPVVCVNRPDGDRLVPRARNGARVRMATRLREGWAPCLLPEVTIEGTEDPDEFVLVHGHYDSWYVGIGDNATGDAALLELARILHGLRGRLRRSVRIAWWPGHSTGRYAGSTWYADEFADRLDEWCIAQLNIDSPGCAGATAYEEVMWMAEASSLCTGAIRDALGAPSAGMRPLRAGDYSFNQIGPTGFYMLLSNIPAVERQARGYYAVGGCGGNVAWHTPNDLPDVADLDILRRDLSVYVTTILRVVNAPLHPFDYTQSVDEIAGAVAAYQEQAAGIVDLSPIVEDLGRVRRRIDAWQRAALERIRRDPADAALRRRLNATLRRVARTLVPLNYARGERFDHDPAVKLPPVPRLEPAASIASLPPEQQRLVRTGLVRERNKIRAMLRRLALDLQADPA